MDTSGLSSGLVLVIALALFAYLTAAEARYALGEAGRGPSQTATNTPTALWLLLTGAILATTLSSIALFLSFASTRWTLLSLWALGTLALLFLIRYTILLVTRRSQRSLFPFTEPLVRLLAKPTPQNSEHKDFTAQMEDEGSDLAEEQERTIQAELHEGLDERERGMIHSILRLDQVTAREIMVPRVDIAAADIGTSLPEVATLIAEHGHTKLPVYRETIDEIVGVVHARDMLEVLAKGKKDVPLEDLVRPAFFIPESKPVDELLQELQEKRVQLALVVDEYGGIEGLVTMEDVLEEIVGEIEDEFSHDEPRLVVINEHEAMVDARLNLDDVNEALATQFRQDNVDTIGGLVYSILDRMPRVGDEIEVAGLKISVVSTRGRRIRQLRVTRLHRSDQPSDQPEK